MKIITNVTLSLFLISCASKNIQVHEQTHQDEIGEIISSGGTTKVRYFSLFENSSKEQSSSKRVFKRYEKLNFKHDVMNNSTVKWWINYYVSKDRDRFQRMLNRGEKIQRSCSDYII